ncbi:MAG: ribose 5-phosphate isomerase B [Christensenellales bacterium]|nr:ribose 5-phosphate isomerase B [Christensenellales bacterium]
MRIAIGNDHAGVELKRQLVVWLEKHGYEVVNFGTDSPESTDYPVYAEKVAKAVTSGTCDRGILICGTGIGISIAANKLKGVRCALCADTCSAALTRLHNDANILAMGARIIGAALAESIVETFLTTEFMGAHHRNRIDMIAQLEENQTVE